MNRGGLSNFGQCAVHFKKRTERARSEKGSGGLQKGKGKKKKKGWVRARGGRRRVRVGGYGRVMEVKRR